MKTLQLLVLALAAAPAYSQTCPEPPDAAQQRDLDKARTLRLDGKLDAATTLVDGVLTRAPGSATALYAKGLILAAQTKYADAEAALQQSVDQLDQCPLSTPKPDYSVYNTLGWVQMVRGDTDKKAEANFKRALGHERELGARSVARAQSNLGYLYYTQGRFEEARKPLEAAKSTGSTDAEATLAQVTVAQKIYTAGVARVYLHVPDAAHDADAKKLEAALEAQGYNVPGIEHVSVAPDDDEVRYFLPEDADRATTLAQRIQTATGRTFHVKHIGGYEKSPNVKAGQVEVWYGKGQ